MMCVVAVAGSLSVENVLAQPAPPATQPAPATAPAAAPATPTDAEIALQRKLDQPFNLTLEKVALSEAFKQIAATAQISLQVDPACYDALPYGQTTRVSADFRNSKLKSAIEEVLVPLSLQQTVSGATVVIRPSGPLARIGRRADWEELKLLQELRTGPDLKLAPNGDFDWTTALRASLDSRPQLVVSFAGEGAVPRALQDKAMEQLKKQLPLSAFRALELYTQLTHQIWFVEAGPLTGSGSIHIMPLRSWIDRQLQRPIQLAFTSAPLDQVVAELSHLSGIRFTPEPGLYRAVPVVSLAASNCSVMQALETLSGATPIAFDIRDDSILLHLAGNSPAPAPTSPRVVDSIVGRIAVPVGSSGMSMDVMIHESDLTPEMNEMRKKKIAEALQAMEKAWTPAETTQPATPPVPPVPATAPAPEKKAE
jgi:hypothetical protein